MNNKENKQATLEYIVRLTPIEIENCTPELQKLIHELIQELLQNEIETKEIEKINSIVKNIYLLGKEEGYWKGYWEATDEADEYYNESIGVDFY